jgi:hypothetical protein
MALTAKCLAGAALIVSGCFAGAALAQSGQAAPKADAGTTAQSQCLTDSGGFKMVDDHAAYTIELTNNCEQRLKCQVYVYVSSAKGPAHGHATLVLAPKSRGAAAKKTYVLKVKMLGGITQSTRECKVM